MSQREYAEWFNYWCENASGITSDRVMLIGDSITNSYRGMVQNLVKEKGLLVDMAVGSRGVEDPALFAELEYVLGAACGYKYKTIHFNNGLHAGYMTGEVYEAGMRKCIDLIKRLQPEAELILVTSTPIVPKGKEGTVDPEKNAKVLERNEVVRKLAAELNYRLDDLFEVVAGKIEYPQPDSVHFGEEGRTKLAEIVASVICK